jgi:selenium metabolism protein YedF
MTETVDARGLACPQPVLRTRKAMEQASHVVTLVDTASALANVSRMAQKAGWSVAVVEEQGGHRLELARGDVIPVPISAPALGRAETLSGPLVLVISADQMGRGDEALGQILVRSFFHTLTEVEPRPDTVILFNTGVRLACEASPVLDDLRALEESGITLLVCGTCLNYLDLEARRRAGQVSNMYDIAETMLGAGKLVNI